MRRILGEIIPRREANTFSFIIQLNIIQSLRQSCEKDFTNLSHEFFAPFRRSY